MSKMPRVPDRDSKKAPKTVQTFRVKVGRHLEVVDRNEKKRHDTQHVHSTTNTKRNYRSFVLLVIGVLCVLLAILVVVRVASSEQQ